MPTIGYVEGIDPLTLTRLSAAGIGTMPISNGFDNHGKFINNLSERDQVDLLVGHLQSSWPRSDRASLLRTFCRHAASHVSRFSCSYRSLAVHSRIRR